MTGTECEERIIFYFVESTIVKLALNVFDVVSWYYTLSSFNAVILKARSHIVSL